MGSKLRLLLLILTLALGPVFSLAAGLEPGAPAPALSIKTWYKGEPVTSLDPNQTYVVEFWATWCGPCRTSIPHLSDLAKKNPDVTFIGVSVWEEDKDGNIAKFVQEMGDKMSYRVGYSGNQDGMAKTWMEAAGQNGIPAAFVVKNGVVQWVGHPMAMDKPLAQIKAGTFDLKKHQAEFREEADANRRAMAINEELMAIQKQYAEGKQAEAKTKLQAFATKYPERKSSADSIRYGWLAKEDAGAWWKETERLLASKNEMDRQRALSFALRQAGKDGDPAMGKRVVELALRTADAKDLLTLQYANAFYRQTKEYRAALSVVEKMIALAPTLPEADREEFRKNLEKSKAELETLAKSTGN